MKSQRAAFSWHCSLAGEHLLVPGEHTRWLAAQLLNSRNAEDLLQLGLASPVARPPGRLHLQDLPSGK
jgi:hypothetical protein